MCVHKEEAKTKMDLVIEALSANTAALKAFTSILMGPSGPTLNMMNGSVKDAPAQNENQKHPLQTPSYGSPLFILDFASMKNIVR